jgi:hypothetical protein
MSHCAVRPVSLALLLACLMASPCGAQVPAEERQAQAEEEQVRAKAKLEAAIRDRDRANAQLRAKEAQLRARKAQLQVEVQAEDEDDAAEDLAAQPAFMFADENFDQWLYRELQNTAGARSRLDTLLLMRLEDVTQACDLEDWQRQKLQLAGRGDINRFFDRVEELRRKFQLVKTDQNRVGEILQEMQPLQLTFQTGPFGDTSIFAKTLKTTLTSEQHDGYEAAGRERRQFRYQACVELLVTKLDEALVMRGEQRRQFERLLLEETRPPARFGPYDRQVVMLQAAQISEDKLKPLFDDHQWKILSRQLQKARELEPFLKNGGMLPGGAGGDGAAAQPGGLPPGARIKRVRGVQPAPGF